MVQVELTVGKLDASLALLLTKDHHLIEFPTILLPDDITPGSIVKLDCNRDIEAEQRAQTQFNQLQEDIFNSFGKYEPKDPQLKILNITQTCCVLEWDNLDLGTSELKSLSLYKNGVKMTNIRNPITKKTIKFSGLPIDTPYKFQLKMETSCGIYWSNLIELRTHKMTDLSGITICIGDIDYNNEHFNRLDIDNIIKSIGAKPINDLVKVDTTQFICTKDTGIQYQAALEANIPIVRPEWLKACQLERRIVGVNKFYLNAETPLWKERDFWSMEVKETEAEAGDGAETDPEQKADVEVDPEVNAESESKPTEDADVVIPTIHEPIDGEDDESNNQQALDDSVKTGEEQMDTEPVVEDRESNLDQSLEVETEETPSEAPVEEDQVKSDAPNVTAADDAQVVEEDKAEVEEAPITASNDNDTENEPDQDLDHAIEDLEPAIATEEEVGSNAQEGNGDVEELELESESAPVTDPNSNANNGSKSKKKKNKKKNKK